MIPLLLVMVVFVWGFNGYMDMHVIPGHAAEYHVTGKQWLWQITHPNGEVSVNEMYVPARYNLESELTAEVKESGPNEFDFRLE